MATAGLLVEESLILLHKGAALLRHLARTGAGRVCTANQRFARRCKASQRVGKRVPGCGRRRGPKGRTTRDCTRPFSAISCSAKGQKQVASVATQRGVLPCRRQARPWPEKARSPGSSGVQKSLRRHLTNTQNLGSQLDGRRKPENRRHPRDPSTSPAAPRTSER